MKIEVKYSGVSLSDVAKRVDAFAKRAMIDGIAELNSGGKVMKASMAPILAHQTGLKQGTISRFLKEKPASVGSPIYELRGSGGDIRAKFFQPKETSSGVTILPRGVPVSLAGAFIKGGSPLHRVPLKMGGNVFKRAGGARRPIVVQRSGVFIAVEMTKGRTLAYVEDSAQRIGAQIVRAFTSTTI